MALEQIGNTQDASKILKAGYQVWYYNAQGQPVSTQNGQPPPGSTLYAEPPAFTATKLTGGAAYGGGSSSAASTYDTFNGEANNPAYTQPGNPNPTPPPVSGVELPAPVAPPATPPPTTPPTTVQPTAQQLADTANQQSASASIATFLANVPGLSTLDPTGALASWMNGQVSTLAGQGIDSSTIVSTIEDTMNNPNGDAAAKAVFDAVFPGYNEKIQSGTTNSNGSYTGIAGYLQYANQVQSFAQTANLPQGTITAQTIGNMWAGDISSGEVSDRITSAYTAATQTPQPVQDYLQSTYGIGPGGIAGFYLNPTNTLSTLSSVNTGIAGVQSGFGSLSQSQAASLSAFLATPSSNGMNLVSSQQATSALAGGLGNGIQGSAAQLAQGGFESAAPGQSSTGTVSQDTLLGAVEGNASALQQTEHAQEARTAGAKGGGGAATTSSGAVGLGYANS